MVVSGIDAWPTTRLYEIWLEQAWGTKLTFAPAGLQPTPNHDRQIPDDFTNASLGWTAAPSLNQPSGGLSPLDAPSRESAT